MKSTISKNKFKGILFVLIATFFTALAQLSFKIGSNSSFFLGPLPVNFSIILGFLSYAAAGLLFLFALRRGDLSLMYPFWSLSFVWVLLVSGQVLGESIVLSSWLGTVLIIIGISLLGASHD